MSDLWKPPNFETISHGLRTLPSDETCTNSTFRKAFILWKQIVIQKKGTKSKREVKKKSYYNHISFFLQYHLNYFFTFRVMLTWMSTHIGHLVDSDDHSIRKAFQKCNHGILCFFWHFFHCHNNSLKIKSNTLWTILSR